MCFRLNFGCVFLPLNSLQFGNGQVQVTTDSLWIAAAFNFLNWDFFLLVGQKLFAYSVQIIFVSNPITCFDFETLNMDGRASEFKLLRDFHLTKPEFLVVKVCTEYLPLDHCLLNVSVRNRAEFFSDPSSFV